MLKWIDKFFLKFRSKAKYQVVINDTCDLLDIKSNRTGKIIVIKSSDIDFFLNEFVVPQKFFYVDVFDQPSSVFIDINNSRNDVDYFIESRAKLRIKLNSGVRFEESDLHTFINSLIKKGLK